MKTSNFQEIFMRYRSLSLVLASVGFAALLSGCVVAPIGARAYGAYPGPVVYAEPAPVVVVPAPAYYGYYGYYGYRGHWGHRYGR